MAQDEQRSENQPTQKTLLVCVPFVNYRNPEDDPIRTVLQRAAKGARRMANACQPVFED